MKFPNAVGGTALACGLVCTLAGCGGGSKSPSQAVSTVTATSMVTVTQTSAQQPSTTGPPPTEVSTTESSSAAGAPVESWIMPNEIGKNLQRAQDDLQALTGNPMYVSTSEDLTGRGRQQIMDRNWQVCSSTPAPGMPFTSQTNVVFGVVKDSESCP